MFLSKAIGLQFELNLGHPILVQAMLTQSQRKKLESVSLYLCLLRLQDSKYKNGRIWFNVD